MAEDNSRSKPLLDEAESAADDLVPTTKAGLCTRPGVMIAAVVLNFVVSMAYGSSATFLPNIMRDKYNCTEWQTGILFGAMPAVSMVFSPIFGAMSGLLGGKGVCLVGVIISGVFTVVFGFMDSYVWFVVIRAIQGFGQGASVVGINSIVAGYYGSDISKIMGVIEVAASLSNIVSAPAGGAIYAATGFKWPFIINGASQLLVVPLLFVVLPWKEKEDEEKEKKKGVSVLSMLRPELFLVGFLTFFGMSSFCFLDAALSPRVETHLHIKKNNSTIVGILFGVYSIAYGLSSPVVGWTQDKIGKVTMICLGCWVTAAGYALLGPLPIANIEDITVRWVLISLGMIVIPVGGAMTILPTLPYMTLAAEPYGEVVVSSAAGFWNAAMMLGEAGGPFLGTVMLTALNKVDAGPGRSNGFAWVCLIFASGHILISALFGLVNCCKCCRKRPSHRTLTETPMDADTDGGNTYSRLDTSQ